jgi:hypothetical protein
LQALRCEYAEARLRTVEAEEELRAARLRIADLDAQLQKIYASRWWKVRKRVAWCWHLVLRWLGRLDRTQSNAVVPRV